MHKDIVTNVILSTQSYATFSKMMFLTFLSFRLLMLPLTCTASMGCPLPETQGQLSMVTRSVFRQTHNNLTQNDVAWFLVLTLDFLYSRVKPLFFCIQSTLLQTSLHLCLQFYRSLSQITQQLYCRVGSIHFQFTF